ncbi:hypothetical protein [Fodinicola feengrottensis]|nr:hypothetical protein [Fodinicola feengrottensis]
MASPFSRREMRVPEQPQRLPSSIWVSLAAIRSVRSSSPTDLHPTHSRH